MALAAPVSTIIPCIGRPRTMSKTENAVAANKAVRARPLPPRDVRVAVVLGCWCCCCASKSFGSPIPISFICRLRANKLSKLNSGNGVDPADGDPAGVDEAGVGRGG
eukprot:4101687-Pyramimonas_sp.AAC.1